jgi:hypothetical protein
MNSPCRTLLLLVYLLIPALAGCEKSVSSQDARPEKNVQIDLAMIPVNPDNPCDSAERIKALVEAADGGAYIGCGTLARYQIREVVEARKAEFLACHQQANNATATKRFLFSWTIQPDGTVHEVKMVEGPSTEPKMQQCISKQVQKLAFPRPLGGGIVEVRWPFTFSSGRHAD